MQPPALIKFSLVLILVSEGLNKEDTNWKIHVKRIYEEPSGSNVTIQCNFTYPERYHTDDVKVYWKKSGSSVCSKGDIDKGAFVSHENKTCVLDDYKGRTRLIGQPAKGECTLEILNVRKNEPKIYLRIFAKNENYSFKAKPVSILVIGNPPVISGPDASYSTDVTGLPFPTNKTSENSKEKIIYLATFIPVAVVFLVLVGILIIIKRKSSSKSFTREESGYYANFSRASSDTPQSILPGMKGEQTPTEPKVINEPVYINLEAPTTEMHQVSDHPDPVYGNVNYST